MLVMALAGAMPPKPEAPAQLSLLTGQVLVASPRMGNPSFSHTVVLIVRHNKDGAFGVTINRPLGEHSLASLLEILGENDESAEGNVQLFEGGPVQPDAMFIVHTAEYHRPETMTINERLAVTSSREVVHDIGHNKGPHKNLVAFGYAGWAPGQLEAELARDDWFTAPAEEKLVFDVSRERVWEEALVRRIREL